MARINRFSKFGRNPEIDTTTGFVEIWYGGRVTGGTGAYPFPTSAATASIVSADAADDAAGTGARTLTIFGVSEATGGELFYNSETVSMDGATPVVSSNEYVRLHRAFVATAGSGGTNAGDITITIGGNTVVDVEAGSGQTEQAVYTAAQYSANPDTDSTAMLYTNAKVGRFTADFTSATGPAASGTATVVLEMRSLSGGVASPGPWIRKLTHEVSSDGGAIVEEMLFGDQAVFAPPFDVRVASLDVSVNNTSLVTTFDLVKFG